MGHASVVFKRISDPNGSPKLPPHLAGWLRVLDFTFRMRARADRDTRTHRAQVWQANIASHVEAEESAQ